MPSIRKLLGKNGNVTYHVTVRLRGQPAQRATFRRLTDARNWGHETEAAIRQGRQAPGGRPRKQLLRYVIERYLRDVLPAKQQSTRHSQRHQLEFWQQRLGDYYLTQIDPAQIAAARDALLAEGRSPATTVRYMAALSHVYRVAMREWRLAHYNPVGDVAKPQEPRGRVRFLSPEETGCLMAACRESRSKCLYDVVLLALTTGARRGEILGLTWSDVDFKRRRLIFHNTKNGETRAAPLVAPAYDALLKRSKIYRLDNPHVFPGGQADQPANIEIGWRNARSRAGIEDFRFHDLRHTAASYLAMSGATTLELAEILGHKTLAMVQRYAHLTESHTRSIVERMTKALFVGGQGK